MDNWNDCSGSFVEKFNFNKRDLDVLTDILEPLKALHVIEKLASLIELKKELDKSYNDDSKKVLEQKFNKIENGLTKAIETLGTLDQTSKDVLPQYMYYQELELTNYRNDNKLSPKFDPRTEILITLNAIKELKSNLGKPSRLPIWFALEILKIWENHVGKLDHNRLQKSFIITKTDLEADFDMVAKIALKNIGYVVSEIDNLYKNSLQ